MDVERLILAAQTAPSADNCQPFRFTWNGTVLAIQHDAQRARHRLNMAGHASLLGLGCTLEALDLAAQQQGLATEVTLDLAAMTGPWAQLRFAPATKPLDSLAAALMLRCTDRRGYQGGDLADAVFAEVRDDALAVADVELALIPPTAPVERYLLVADGLLWRDPRILEDALRWLRHTDAQALATRDGVSWRNLGVSRAEALSLRVLGTLPGLLSLARPGGEVAGRFLAARQLRSGAAVGCIAVRGVAADSVVAAGRLGLRAWLRLNRAGYALQPLSLASLCVFSHRTGNLPHDLAGSLRDHFANGQRDLGVQFGLSAQACPVWMFRTGRAPPGPPPPRTLRLPTADVLRRTQT